MTFSYRMMKKFDNRLIVMLIYKKKKKAMVTSADLFVAVKKFRHIKDITNIAIHTWKYQGKRNPNMKRT